MGGEVVSRAQGVAIRVGEPALDRLVIPALFVRQHRRHARKTIAGYLVLPVRIKWVLHISMEDYPT